MNIFRLDENPIKAAQYHCDRHVVKMVLETAQLLSTAHRLRGSYDERLYRATHAYHPCAVWVRETSANYEWTFNLFDALCYEYTFRYHKVHATQSKLLRLLSGFPPDIEPGPQTRAPVCMPVEYMDEGDPVASYRAYYSGAKRHLHTWTGRSAPEWLP